MIDSQRKTSSGLISIDDHETAFLRTAAAVYVFVFVCLLFIFIICDMLLQANGFKKRVEGDSEACAHIDDEDENNELTHGSSAASVPSKDLSIKSGEKIKVLVPVRGSRAKVASETTGTGTENAVSKGPISVGNRNGTTLLPPPSAAKLLPPPQGGSAPVVISNGHLPPPPHVDHFADLYSESTPVNVSSISMSTQGNVPIYSNTDTIITGSTDAKVPDSEDWGDFEAA